MSQRPALELVVVVFMPHQQIQTPRITVVLQQAQDGEPDMRVDRRLYVGDELVGTTLLKWDRDAWPDCMHCGEEIVVAEEVHATADGLHHLGCTPPTRKRKR